jgi:tetratricopeptide (TPR) repeat protein
MAKIARRPDRAAAVLPQKSKAASSLAAPSNAQPLRVVAQSRDAVGLFQQGMEALQRHQYAGAAEAFRELLEDGLSDRTLLDRTRVYLSLCERELRRQPARPITAEERVTAATAALNDGRDEEAERLAHAVLDEAPDHDLALYLLAAIHARRGEPDMALDWLGRALDVSPDVSAQARHDSDFESLRDLDRFRHLLEASFSAQSGARRRTALRSDR